MRFLPRASRAALATIKAAEGAPAPTAPTYGASIKRGSGAVFGP